jgi:hypothetical protein
MKRLWFLVGAGIGFVLGSRAGPGPYERLEAKVRSVTSRPEVEDATARMKVAAQEQVGGAVDRVAKHVPVSTASTP